MEPLNPCWEGKEQEQSALACEVAAREFVHVRQESETDILVGQTAHTQIKESKYGKCRGRDPW